MVDMHKTTVYLDDRVFRKLRSLAEATGRPQAVLIREALARYAASPAKRPPRSIGLGRSGTRDLSDRAEDLLKGFGEEK